MNWAAFEESHLSTRTSVFCVFGLSLATLSARANPLPQPVIYNLVVGRTLIAAGHAIVINDGANLYVTYDLVGYAMTTADLNVACSAFPKGNPSPGQFPFSQSFNPAVSSYTFTIPLTDSHLGGTANPGCGGIGNQIYIATHAAVEGAPNASSQPVNTVVTKHRYGSDNSNWNSTPNLTTPTGAQYSWMPQGGSFPADIWDTNLVGFTAASFHNGGADWIWECYRTDCGSPNPGAAGAPISGEIIQMDTTFNQSTIPTAGASLAVTCDNGYDVLLNGNYIGSSPTTHTVGSDWKDSDLTEDHLNTEGWENVVVWSVPNLFFHVGSNKLTVLGGNEHYDNLNGNPSDTNDMLGNVGNNPGGCIFLLFGATNGAQDTAWGSGTKFGGSNWAMYEAYTMQ